MVIIMEDYSHTTPVHTKQSRSLGLIYILPLGLCIGFALFVGVRLVRGDLSLSEMTPTSVSPTLPQQLAAVPTVQSTPVKQSMPTPTPGKPQDKATLVILVLNGSGEKGVAGKLADELKTLGYTDIRTGNAGKYTYTDVTIRRTANQVKAAGVLKQELEKSYKVSEVQEDTLQSNVDLELIIGKTASVSAKP
jgi:hypothetical protein